MKLREILDKNIGLVTIRKGLLLYEEKVSLAMSWQVMESFPELLDEEVLCVEATATKDGTIALCITIPLGKDPQR